MDEENVTVNDLENMGLNTDILELDMLYTNDEAKDILEGFKWGHTFLELNHDLLESYSKADTSAEVVKIQNEFLENHN